MLFVKWCQNRYLGGSKAGHATESPMINGMIGSIYVNSHYVSFSQNITLTYNKYLVVW